MVKFIRGKFGCDVIKQLTKEIHYKRVHEGKLPHINPKEEKQIIERTAKVFSKDGKAPYKIRERDFEKEILNPLRIRRDDRLDSREINEIDKVLGLSDHTKQIGGKYFRIIRQERKEAQKKSQKVEELEKTSKPTSDFKEFRDKLDKVIDIKKGKITPKESAPVLAPNAIIQNIKGFKMSESGSGTVGKASQKQGLLAKTSGYGAAGGKIKESEKPKSGLAHAAFFAPAVSYRFSGGVPKRDIVRQEPDSEMPKKASKLNDSPPEIPEWKMAAYSEESPKSSEFSDLSDPVNSDIDT